MFTGALSPERAYQLLAREDDQLAGLDRVEKWTRTLAEAIPALDVFDEQLIDIPRLARDTARLLGPEIERAARQPGSALAIPLLLARTASPGAEPDMTENTASSFVRMASGTVSNLASLPLSEHPVPRPEQDAVEAVLAEHGMAVIAGGPGAGKTVLSEMAARSRRAGESLRLLWWVKATTPQHRIEACEALLLEFGEKPADDTQAQVRALLARHGGWFVIVDDAPDFETVRQLIPAEHASDAVLVTTRSAASFPRPVIVELDAADESTLREIARRRLPNDISESELDELLGACAGNPLIVATACAYLADTGASVSALVALMHSAPSRVLAARPDSAGYVGVLESIRSEARSELAWPLLVAVAVSGGSNVPRRVFEKALAAEADAGIRIDEAFRELMSLGVVAVRSAVVESHALTASVVLDLAEPALCAASAELLLKAVHDLVDVPGRRLLPGLAAVVDAAGSLVDQQPLRVTARTLLAERLAEQGLTHSAHRQLEAARAVPGVAGIRAAQLLIVQSEARVHLFAGESARALQLAESVVDDPAAKDELRAAAHVTIAWAAKALGDRTTAQLSIAETLRLVPDAPDVRALHDHFFLLDEPAAERVDRYLELAESSGTELRGHFLTMASRSSILTGQTSEAVELAQRAVDADRAVGGDRSLNVARDLNDLGMALVADGDLENATTALNESIEIYQEEQESHSHAALPMLHLGRVLTQRAQKTDPPDTHLLVQARTTLEHAIALQTRAAPDSEDHAGMLYAYGDTFMVFGDAGDPRRALELFREAARIDRAVHGEGHREVGLDVSRMMDAQLMLGDVDAALESFDLVKKHVHLWVADDPVIALNLLSQEGVALLVASGEDSSRIAELPALASQIETLLPRTEIAQENRQMAGEILSEIRKRVG